MIRSEVYRLYIAQGLRVMEIDLALTAFTRLYGHVVRTGEITPAMRVSVVVTPAMRFSVVVTPAMRVSVVA